MILSNNISNVYSRGNEIQRVFSYGKLVWEKLSDDYNGVVFTAEETNSTIGLAKLSTNQTLEYRTDYTNWQEMTANTVITLYNIGDRAYIRGELSADNSTRNYTQFTMTGRISASGNINYIWSKNDLDAPLKAYCGFLLFRSCTSLTQPPELPATELGNYCYYWMFRDTLISTAPELPATTLTEGCYNGMFEHCLNLTTASMLPAKALTKLCYRAMFYNCFNLTTAPELPAKVLQEQCYELMFYNCNELNYIKCLAIFKKGSGQTNRWVEGVASSGVFVRGEYADYGGDRLKWTVGVSGIPEGWIEKIEGENEYEEGDYQSQPFTIEALDENVTVSFYNKIKDNSLKGFVYSLNGGVKELNETNYITIHKGDILRVYQYSIDFYYTIKHCRIRGLSDVYGNILSTQYNYNVDFTKETVWNRQYGSLTSNDFGFFCGGFDVDSREEVDGSDIRSAENLILPATNFPQRAYAHMFCNCRSLITAPKTLIVSNLTHECYYSMFEGCSSLITAPVLPATNLADGCYHYMFRGCISLITPPQLPATTLSDHCYSSMFEGCSSLITAPELPATTLPQYHCYSHMFENCYSLNYIKCYAINFREIDDNLHNWTAGIETNGKLVCKRVDGGKNPIEDYIPDTWTVEYMD